MCYYKLNALFRIHFIQKNYCKTEGLGRVKVFFNWASGSTTSEWMRMIQPQSGAGKGFYFIPEIGEKY
ncbi:phage baseplate assembly protein V [Flavobacterium sp. 7E]|uniref:phage baseplate assembly protein V n=1 Tax=Flavobacterium sp. 7E TaxID=2735898 RepID=UPI0020C69982|nr:phage baseplate assembly protein V [Flavobacterium sp. 7E]